MKFKVAARADRHIRIADAWWRKNRPYAPAMFAENLESAFELIEVFPFAGEAVESRRRSGLRRLLLTQVQYHLYYTIAVDTGIVEVLALWHTSRRRGPSL